MSEMKDTAELRKFILAQMQEVVSGKCDQKTGLTISKMAAEVLKSAKLEHDVYKFNVLHGKGNDGGNHFLRLTHG